MSNIFGFRRPPPGFIPEYFGGGKGGSTTTTNNVTQIPPEVLARYNAVNARAETVADRPYQSYSQDPSAFVAQLNDTQQAGIQNSNIMAGAAQPYYGAATNQLMQAQAGAQPGLYAAQQNIAGAQNTGNQYANTAGQYYGNAMNAASPYYQAASQGLGAGLNFANPLNQQAVQAAGGAFGAAAPYYQAATQGTQGAVSGAQPYQSAATAAALSGAQGVDPGQLQTQQFMNPYTQNVVQATQAAMNQQQGQQLAQQQAEAIRGGAFGGDRAGIQRAQLMGQQSLAQSQAISPLYQQNYQQALNAAQQQQGVGLGAAQANRAAIQQAGQQLGALGQQTYGQQLGAANQMANLGQSLYGQGVTGAQTLSQLGQTGFGQQLSAAQQAQALGQGLYGQGLGLGQAMQGLGQQQYGQGQGTAQQLAALAQQGYGMGAGTSAALAGLGTNAQQAGLSGAQAQLAAGQTQQQTQQAGLQALYNQFQQQQGFPYQQAQFLANIAEGTGALSGNATSGTSTTTGGGAFSDERLKENIKKVGETNDGQPIYRYNFKGDNQTQIGLLAQNVEKSHPDAVGLAGGYKTVDYKKATEDAIHKDGGGAVDGNAYSMVAPSAMLPGGPGGGLGAIPSLPQMITGPQRIQAGASGPDVAALRSPLVSNVGAIGAPEARRAELSSLRSTLANPGPNGSNLGSGPGYIRDRIATLEDWLGRNDPHGGSPGPVANYGSGLMAANDESGGKGMWGNSYIPTSSGGLVGPGGGAFAQGGTFARGGLAEGDYMNPALAFYGPGKDSGFMSGPYGVAPRQSGPRQLLQGTKVEHPKPPPPPGLIQQATQIGQLASAGKGAWGDRPDFLRTEADLAARKAAADEQKAYTDALRTNAIAQAKGPPAAPSAALPSVDKRADYTPDIDNERTLLALNDSEFYAPDMAARGGLIADRHHYYGGGAALPYGGLGGGNALLGSVIDSQDTTRRVPGDKGMPAAPRQQPQSGGLGELTQMANLGKQGKSAFDWAAKQLAGDASPTGLAPGATEAAATGETAAELGGAAPEVLAGAAPEVLAGAGEAAAGLAGAGEAAAGLAGLAGAGEAAAAGASLLEFLPFLGLLSDKRAKHDIKKVGKLYDGQPVYRYAYNGDDRTQMGLLAQDVEKVHPGAVGLAGGLKTVDYKKATGKAAKRGHFEGGGGLSVGDLGPALPSLGATEKSGVPVPPDVAKALEERQRKEREAEGAVALARNVAPTGAPERPVNASRAPFEYATRAVLPDSMSEKTKDALTSSNFWVPALAGIGSMLASPNQRVAAAIGSGLVGATTAYTGLQKQQSDIDLQQAQERVATVDAAKRSFIFDAKGLATAVLVSTPTGMRYMDFGEAYRNRENLNILPATRREMEAMVKDNPELIGSGTKNTGAVIPEPATPPAPVSPKENPFALRPVEQIFGITKAHEGRIASEIDKRIGTDTSGIKDEFARKTDLAKDSLEQRPLLMQLGAAFAGLPKESLMASGAAAPVASTLAGWGNSILKTIGAPPIVNEKDIARAEKIQKITSQINKEVTESSGQKSYGAYNAMSKMFPTMGTSGEGFADNFASIVIANQMPEDENRFSQQWLKSASKINPTYAVTTGPAVSEAFKDTYGPIYERDRKAIAAMFSDSVMQNGKPLLDPDTKRPVNWFQYISEHGGKIKPEIKKAIESRYGEGILRYFPGVTR